MTYDPAAAARDTRDVIASVFDEGALLGMADLDEILTALAEQAYAAGRSDDDSLPDIVKHSMYVLTETNWDLPVETITAFRQVAALHTHIVMLPQVFDALMVALAHRNARERERQAFTAALESSAENVDRVAWAIRRVDHFPETEDDPCNEPIDNYRVLARAALDAARGT